MAHVFVLRRVFRSLSIVALGAGAASLVALAACGPPETDIGVDFDAAAYGFGEDAGQTPTPNPTPGPSKKPDGGSVIGDPRDASPPHDAADAGEDAPFDAGTCTGVAESCSLQIPGDCNIVLGCTEGTEPGCSGISASCFDQFDDLSCDELQGCFWDSASSSCSGDSDPCTLMSEVSCGGQEGCTWSFGACAGFATPCSSFTGNACYDQLGCLLQ